MRLRILFLFGLQLICQPIVIVALLAHWWYTVAGLLAGSFVFGLVAALMYAAMPLRRNVRPPNR